jgi:hypothetical protein
MSGGADCARPDETMTALRLSQTLVATFVGSLGAALGLYGRSRRYRPFLRDIHQQSEWAASAAGAACIAAVLSAIERLIEWRSEQRRLVGISKLGSLGAWRGRADGLIADEAASSWRPPRPPLIPDSQYPGMWCVMNSRRFMSDMGLPPTGRALPIG